MSVVKVDSPDGSQEGALFDGSFFWDYDDQEQFKGNFSLIVWLKNVEINDEEVLWWIRGENFPDEDFKVSVISDTEIKIKYGLGTEIYTVPSINNGSWRMIGITRDNGIIKFFYDGNQTGIELNSTQVFGGSDILFGYTSALRNLRAEVFDHRIYDNRLSPEVVGFAYDDMINNNGNKTLPPL